MAKPNKVVGVEEGERAYASSAEMEELKSSIEALKKVQEDNNTHVQMQMDKLVGLMANFMKSSTKLEPFDKQSSCQGNFGNPSVSVVPSIPSLGPTSPAIAIDGVNGANNITMVTTSGMNLNPGTSMGNFSSPQIIMGEQNGRQGGIDSPPGLAQYMINLEIHHGPNLASGVVPYWPMQ